MPFDYLRAKSGTRTGAARPQSLLEHTQEVLNAAQRLVELTGRLQLQALGLDPEVWMERLRRDIRLAAFMHDLGKANNHFQGMVWGTRPYRQAIRHEAVSYWIATQPNFREWVAPGPGLPPSVMLVLWAIAGHHRKFPPEEPGEAGQDVQVLSSHPGFREVLAWGRTLLGLGEIPPFPDATLQFTRKESVMRGFDEAQVEANRLWRGVSPEEKRYLALLKACLICADVAGSICRRGAQSMAEWMTDAFANVATVGDLEGIVAKKLRGKSLRDFQESVAARTERVVFVRAGCGTGKTLAAYHWAARLAERTGRDYRLFFCYPTMGTATEGYRDYLMDPEIDAALIHGRSQVDMELLGLGDDEPDPHVRKLPEDQVGRAARDSSMALDHWSTPLVSCTVDTVLGLVQNNRRGILAWPSIAGSALIFDEIHSYDNELFSAFLRFLADVRGVPCLLMTASLPRERLERLKARLEAMGETLGEVPGPQDLEEIQRYRRVEAEDPWEVVAESLARGRKVLWVVNTVDEALRLADSGQAKHFGARLYHSRFRYLDRVNRHREVIDLFDPEKNTGSALAICTQVAEMSLDLSADLLVTHLAPIAALIQRLGRLNRRATRDDPWPFLVYSPRGPLPYQQSHLDEAKAWLQKLGPGGLSQSDLITHWISGASAGETLCSNQSTWLDGGFTTKIKHLRESSPGIEVILPEDKKRVESGELRPEEVRIPMPVPNDHGWHQWPEIAFCKVPPRDRIDYDPMRGARWKN